MKLEASVLNSAVLDNMLQRLADRKSPELRLRLLFELNRKLDELEMKATLPWFLEDRWVAALSQGAESVALPDDFIREMEGGELKLTFSDGLLVPKKTTEDMVDLSAVGPPQYYYLLGETLYFYPVLDRDYTMKLAYYKATEAVVDNAQPVSNLWLKNAYNYTVAATLRSFAMVHLQSDEMAVRFGTEEKVASDLLWKLHEARQHTNADYKIED